MDWSAIGMDALLGAAAGLVGVGVAKVFKLPPQKQSILIAGLVAVSLGVSSGWQHRKTPRERMIEAMQSQRAGVTSATPPLQRAQAYTSGEMAGSAAAVDWLLAESARNSANLRTAAAAKVGDGLRRLDDQTLAERAQLMSELLEPAPVHACAGIGRGDSSSATLEGLFARATDAQLRAWARIAVRSMDASIRNGAPRPLADADLTAALEQLQAQLTPDDATRFTDIGPRFATASDDDVCFFTRTMFRGALTATGAQRTTLLSVLVASPQQ